jgi:hypothetical protein
MKQKEFFNLAAEIEKECGDWENSEGMSKEAYDSLMKKADEIIAKQEAEKKKKSVASFRKKKRYIIALAAVLVLLMGTGVV